MNFGSHRYRLALAADGTGLASFVWHQALRVIEMVRPMEVVRDSTVKAKSTASIALETRLANVPRELGKADYEAAYLRTQSSVLVEKDLPK
jgi:hypothetical protein